MGRYPQGIIDPAIERLREYGDRCLDERLTRRKKETTEYVEQFVQCARCSALMN